MERIKYISAGAGSGKTTHIVKELVDIVGKGKVSPSEIIMTTYTIAAAQEMRERARKGLLDAGMAQRANELDAAAIGTVHAVCLGMIQKYWYLLGLSPELRQLEDNDLKIYTNKSIDQMVSIDDIQQFERLRRELNIQHFDGSVKVPYTEYWRDALKEVVEKARYYEVSDLEQSRKESLAEIDSVFCETPDMDAIQRELAIWEEYLNGCGGRSAVKAERQLKAIRKYKQDLNRISQLSDVMKVFADPAAGNRQMPVPDSASIVTELNKCALSELVSKHLKEILNKIFGMATEWTHAYKEYKRKHHLLDFNDMELYFEELITKHEEARADIRAHYKLLMVDEFQDCNPVQLRIFRKLSEIISEQSELDYCTIWVGDPKQAIYSFRGSDTDLVQRATASIANREPLKFSWRSRPQLVNWTNKFFLPIFTKMGLTESEIVLKYPSDKKSDSLGENVPAIKRWKTEHKDHEQFLAQAVLNLHEENHAWGDIAILMRYNTNMDVVVEAMRNRGIPVSAPETDLWPRAEVQLLLALLEYTNEIRFRTHLRADILHLIKNQSTEDVLNSYLQHFVSSDEKTRYEWKKDDELIAEIEKIMYAVAKKGYYEQLCAYVDKLRLYDLVSMWGEAEIRRQNITTILGIAKKFDNHLEQMEDVAKFSDFVQYMADSDIRPTHVTKGDAVQVMTYHRAKGLEWSVVILEDLDTDEVGKIIDHEYLGVKEVRHEDNSYHVRFFPPLKRPDAVDAMIMQQPYFHVCDTRTRQELARLLYVGITRARDLLILDTQNPWTSQGQENSGLKWLEDVMEASSGEVENILSELPTVDVLLPEDFDVEKYHVVNTNPYVLIDTEQTHREALKDEKGKVLKAHINPSTASVPAEHFTTSEQKLNTPAFQTYQGEATDEEQTVRQSTIGTCVHNIYASFNENDDDAQAVDKATEILKAFGLNDMLDANAIIAAIRALYVHLKATYGEAVKVRHEVPFTQRLDNGQVLRGEIDLLWYTSDKECVLVDFKNIQSDTPNPDHYRGQMAAYRSALQAANIECNAIVLYYASMGTVVTMSKAQ